MILFNPKKHTRKYPDEKSRQIMLKTIEFFEKKGLKKIKADWRRKVWNYDFVDFLKDNQVFATLMTPAGYGAPDSRWDTYRNCEFSEITGFYGLTYWYTWQVSMLGLGPVWMGANEEVKRKTAKLCFGGPGLWGVERLRDPATHPPAARRWPAPACRSAASAARR